MPPTTKQRKFYLRAPDLEFRVNGPIKIGNVITDMTLPQDPITYLNPLPKIIAGASYSQGKANSEHHALTDASLSAKMYSIFGGQAESTTSRSLQTTYTFEKISAWFLEKNPTTADIKNFRAKDKEFDSALRNGPVYVVTGLKVAKGLKYSTQQVSEQKSGIIGWGHVTQDATIEGKSEAEAGGENTDTWTILGDTILAYRLHIVKKRGWSWKGQDNLTTKTHDPGDGGFMSSEDKEQGFEIETGEIFPTDVDYFATEQEFERVRYQDLEDEDEGQWFLAILEG